MLPYVSMSYVLGMGMSMDRASGRTICGCSHMTNERYGRVGTRVEGS